MKQKFKKGAASMYVVVIAALLFGVITVSFIRIIVANQIRSTNNELSQSAYDSALAGVEDAKTALIKYYQCLSSGQPVPTSASEAEMSDTDGCKHVLYYVDNALANTLNIPNDSENCRTIEKALQRLDESDLSDDDAREVEIEQTVSSGSNTKQAYTCVTVNDKLDDYRATLSSGLTTRVIPLKYVGDAAVTGIRIAWYSSENGTSYAYGSDNAANYRFNENYSTPPVISAQLIQTASTFNLDSFTSKTDNSHTNRGTLFLTPRDVGANPTTTHFAKDAFPESNDHDKVNNPSMVNCKHSSGDSSPDEEFACATTIELPDPVDTDAAGRNKETFFLVVSLPYGNPSTDFSIQLCTDDTLGGDGIRGTCETTVQFDGVQTSVDATGRANDMFSRVEARIELSDIYFPYAEFALQLSGDGSGVLNKNFYVTKNCWGTDCENAGNAD